MYRDDVIEEVWRIRDEYARKHRNSLDEIVEDLRRRQAEHPSRIVDRRRQNTSDEPRPGARTEMGSEGRAQER